MIVVDIEARLGAFELAVAFSADAPVVGLFGRSGAGKSTVINAIAGITRPRRGCIEINGVALFDSAKGIDVPPDKRRIGYVFQDALLFPHCSVLSNLLYGQRLRSAAERFIPLERVVALLGLEPLLQRAPRTLSGGERQRVAIGRALLAQPRILLMDEPLASLDMPRKTEILDYIERLRDEFAIPILYVSHSVEEITRLADTVVVLADGRCLAAGAVDDVLCRSDLDPAMDRGEAASLLEARVSAHDSVHHLTTLAFDGGLLYVPHLDTAIGDRVRARIRARDVSLAIERPGKISILNVLSGRVRAIDGEAGPVVDVRVAVGDAVLTARITSRSRHELGLHEGQEVHALIKAVSFDRRSSGYFE